jgi:hypothetical protein
MITDFKKIDSLSHSDFEIFVRDVFVAAGWSDAIISKVGQEFQHGDGGVDIFAYKNKRKFAIEVKQRKAGITVIEMATGLGKTYTVAYLRVFRSDKCNTRVIAGLNVIFIYTPQQANVFKMIQLLLNNG